MERRKKVRGYGISVLIKSVIRRAFEFHFTYKRFDLFKSI